MSGERVRFSAMHGDYTTLMLLLSGGGNACSIDEDGLTALHYAAWNGHILCVEALCANDTVKNKEGFSQSCIDMQSTSGLTALHLAASEGLNAGEVIQVLLFSGADRNILDNLGRTASDLASEEEQVEAIENLTNVHIEVESIAKFRTFLKQKHQLKPRGHFQALDEFDGGDFAEFTREPPRPPELKVSERRIWPSFRMCYDAPRNAQVVKGLYFLLQQSLANEKRRRILAETAVTAEENWRRGNPKVGEPEKELFLMYNNRKKTRIYPLVPIPLAIGPIRHVDKCVKEYKYKTTSGSINNIEERAVDLFSFHTLKTCSKSA